MQAQIGAMEIRSLQYQVAETISLLGGYWRPLSALARVLEEVGELGELLGRRSYINEELAAELADVFVITTCLANQYNANLADEYRSRTEQNKTRSSETKSILMNLRIGLCGLMHQAGRLARLINYYEGDKTPKKDEEISTVAVEVTSIHEHLMNIASVAGIRLSNAIREKLNVNLKRDVGRFKTHWDPTTSASLSAFRPLMDSTPCIFAKHAKVWGAPDYEVRLSIRENAKRFGLELSRFCKIAPYESLDGFVITFTSAQMFNSIENLSATLRHLLCALGEQEEDRGAENCMRSEVHIPSWRFKYGGMTFFITTFAPFYGEMHPRYSQSSAHAFIFMQPEFSFDVNGVHKDNPRREAIKQSIRDNFAEKSHGYLVDLVEQPIEALKYVKPVELNGEPIRWWM